MYNYVVHKQEGQLVPSLSELNKVYCAFLEDIHLHNTKMYDSSALKVASKLWM